MRLYPLRRKGDKFPRRFRPVNMAASVMTTMNLYMGVTSIFASIGNEFRWAANCILLAIVFDMLDGFVARLTKSTSEFGKQLDSLCDLVSFGVAPAVLVFMAYLPEGTHLPLSAKAESIVGETGSYMGIAFVICAALRLARYNTFQSDRRDAFIGLPSPAAGGTLAAFVLFLQYFESRLEAAPLGPLAYFMLGPTMVVLAVLMVSTVHYPKNFFKAFIVKPQHAFIYLAAGAFLVAVVHYALTRSASLVMFPLAMAYVLFGLFAAARGRLSGKTALVSAEEAESEDELGSDDEGEDEDGETDEAPSRKAGDTL
jgi:CDP-diacylglycerol--serine O-phosphatidyltransferase